MHLYALKYHFSGQNWKNIEKNTKFENWCNRTGFFIHCLSDMFSLNFISKTSWNNSFLIYFYGTYTFILINVKKIGQIYMISDIFFQCNRKIEHFCHFLVKDGLFDHIIKNNILKVRINLEKYRIKWNFKTSLIKIGLKLWS